MKNFLLAFTKKATYVLAILIICFALIMTLTRMLTPLLDGYHDQFEVWASEVLHTPVKIQKVVVDWYQYQPAITFRQTTLLNAETKDPILQVQKIRVFFSIPSSLWNWKPILSTIQISGADITIHQNKEGELSVQGFPTLKGFDDAPFAQETKFISVLSWLAKPTHLILHDIDVRYMGLKGQNRFVTLYDFNLENSDSEHHIFGKAVLHQDLPTNITFAADWQGAEVNLATISAKAYLYLSGLSLAQWLKDMDWHGWQVQSGLTSAKIWGTWENGQLQKLQTKLQAYDLDFYQIKSKSHVSIPRLNGNFGWKHDNDKYVIAGDDVILDFPNRLWPINNFYFSYSLDDAATMKPQNITIAYIDLAEVQRLLPYFIEYVPVKISDAIMKLNSTGFIQNVDFTFPVNTDDWQQAKLIANFTNITTQTWGQLPAIQNLTGSVNWNGEMGKISLSSKRVHLNAPDFFITPLLLGQINGDVTMSYQNTHEWILTAHQLTIDNDDVNVTLAGSLTIPMQGKTIADLSAQFSLANAAHISRYLPLKTFENKFQNWIRTSFVSGSLTGGAMTLRGPLQSFPFDDKSGDFVISGDVKDIILRYDSDWPTMEKINGKIVFHNREVKINISDAETSNIKLTNINATIPILSDIKPAILSITGDPIHFAFADALRFVKQSPLDKSIGKIFNNLSLKGPGVLQLKLTIPLQNPDNTQVFGNIDIQSATMALNPSSLTVDGLTGQLQFTEKSVTAHEITGKLLNKPISLNVNTVTGKTPIFRTKFLTNIDIETLRKRLNLPTTDAISGNIDLLGQIDVIDDQPLKINLNSDLRGAIVKLPGNLAKAQNESRFLTAELTVADKAPLLIQANYGNLIKAALAITMNNNKYNLQSTVLHFGSGIPEQAKEPGVFVTGNIKELSWDSVKSYLNQQEKSQFSIATLKNIDINVEKVIFGGQIFNDVDISLTPDAAIWKIDIDGDDIDGTLQIPINMKGRLPLIIRLSRLELSSSSYSSSDDPLDVKSLPPIQFTVDQLSYDNKELGRVTFSTQPNNSGLTIKSFTIVNPRMTLQSYGQWTQRGKQYTGLQGTVTTTRLTDLITSLHIDAHNFVASSGKLTFDLSWPGTPYAVSMMTLNGDVSIDIGKGRIVEIDKETDSKIGLARMLNLFSLQTIPRRLSLDFSDIFQKGYSFDFIKGNYRFTSGNAVTNDMRIEGPIAKVRIFGRIGFGNKDFNLNLRVTPYVTSSIPVAAALITAQPLVGVAAWAVSKVISPQVSKVTTYNYTVTGPWVNPKWESVSGKKP